MIYKKYAFLHIHSFKKQKEERRQKISDLKGKWDAHQSKRNVPGTGGTPQPDKGSWWGGK